jgi:DNA end-binding protein Ku
VARAIWSGSISFGLINIPVKLYSAITERSVRFNQIDTRNGARIRTKKVNAEDGSEVPADVIAKGYEISKGRYVLVADDELASLQPRATHTIDLEEFVDLAEVDPIYFDGAYYVAPDERAAKSYALLVEAMDEAGKVAVARFVMRSKQYVAIMRPREGHLVLSMLVYEDEINPASQIPEFDQLEDVDITPKELAMAEQLIESLSAQWQPEQFHDSYRDELLDLIHAKDAGEERVVAALEAPSDDTVIDLMAALEASVAAAREARGRHPTAQDGSDEDTTAEADDAGDADAASAEPKRAKRSPRKASAKKAPSRPGSAKAPSKAASKATAKKPVAKKATAKAGSKAPARTAARKSA